MLAELRMKLETGGTDFGYCQSSNMQGVLMQRLAPAYAEKLHEQGLKPYSQYLLAKERKEWVVKTFTQEAYQEIIPPLLDGTFTHFVIEKKGWEIGICAKELKTTGKQELLEEFYSGPCSGILNLEFLTPTAFKSNGRYQIFPDMRYIYQSLMNKYSAASAEMEMYDGETLEQLVVHSSVVRYRLHSTFFPLEGVKIPSFKGEITVKVGGTQTMARYARLLARFGEYAGLGIKTAMGMGGLKLERV